MASVAIRDVRKSFGADPCHPRRQRRHRRRRVRRAGRPVGLRQVDPAAHDRGTGEHHRRRNPHRRPRRQQPAAERARHRDGVPELRALSAHDGRRQHGLLDASCAARRRARSTTRVNRAAEILGLRTCSTAIRASSSGGQRQRVAMGRAIVRDPQVFLFDEPLSNLDAKLRVQMRTEIKALHQRLKTTTVYVTHDQIEAMTMADKIVVMHDGLVEQIGAPLELYDRPDNLFVAGFIGSPAMNFLQGTFAAQRQRRVRGPGRRAACRSPRAPPACRRPAGGLRHPARAFRPRRRWRRGRGPGGRADRLGDPARRQTRRPGNLRGIPRTPPIQARRQDPAQARSAARASVRRGDGQTPEGPIENRKPGRKRP